MSAFVRGVKVDKQHDEWKKFVDSMTSVQRLQQIEINNGILKQLPQLENELRTSQLSKEEFSVECEKLKAIAKICYEKFEHLQSF